MKAWRVACTSFRQRASVRDFKKPWRPPWSRPQNETTPTRWSASSARRGATTTRSATPWPRTCARSWRGRRRRRRSIIQMTSRRCPRRRRSACARRSSLRRCRPRRPSRRPSSGPAPRRRPTRRPRSAPSSRARRGAATSARRYASSRAQRGAAAAPRGASPPRRRRRSRRSSRRCPWTRFAPRPFFCLRRPGPIRDLASCLVCGPLMHHVPSTRPPDRRRCGRAADLARDAGCRDAAAALARRASPRPSPKKQSAAPRDLSVPFDAARDSRLHHRGREQAYALRERCRDRFLDLLRD